MKVGDRVLILHDVSLTCDAGRVVWVAGRMFHVRLIKESELGSDYITLHVNN